MTEMRTEINRLERLEVALVDAPHDVDELAHADNQVGIVVGVFRLGGSLMPRMDVVFANLRDNVGDRGDLFIGNPRLSPRSAG